MKCSKIHWTCCGVSRCICVIVILRQYIVFMDVHAITVDKSDDSKDNFYEELQRVLDQYPKYNNEISVQK